MLAKMSSPDHHLKEVVSEKNILDSQIVWSTGKKGPRTIASKKQLEAEGGPFEATSHDLSKAHL
jgi:hypothetical protein